MRDFFAFTLVAILFAVTAGAEQSAVIKNCVTTRPGTTIPETDIYRVFDEGEDLCGGRNVAANFDGNATFEILMYGTRCSYNTTKKWEDAAEGDEIGWVHCPGVYRIAAVREDTRDSGWCEDKTWVCEGHSKMRWEGCLSCGCTSNEDCPSACCDSSTNTCSSPENSACME